MMSSSLLGYLGCYGDDSDRAMAYSRTSSSSMTIEWCTAHCLDDGEDSVIGPYHINFVLFYIGY